MIVWDVELDRRNKIRHDHSLPSGIRLTLNTRWHNEILLLCLQGCLCHILLATCLFRSVRDGTSGGLSRRLHRSRHLASAGLGDRMPMLRDSWTTFLRIGVVLKGLRLVRRREQRWQVVNEMM